MRLFDRLPDIGQRRLGAARIGPDEIADQDEIRAGGRELDSLVARDGKADAGWFEQLLPPLQPLGDRLGRGPLSCTADASALMREIMVFWSVSRSRSSTAATSAPASTSGRSATNCKGSSSSGVAR